MQAWIRHFGFGCVALLALACGSKGDDDDDDTGGSGGTGNTGNTGGSTAGTGASGGTTGGSTTGGGGSGGSMAVTQAYTFDSDEEGWIVQYTSSGDGIDLIDKAAVTLSWVAEGDPDGALQADIPYESKSQYVGIGLSLATPVDLTGKTLRARVKVLSGLGEPEDLMTNPGGAKLYAKSGTGYVYANGVYNPITTIGTWLSISFNLAAPDFVDETNPAGAFDVTDIREIGIQFDTGGTSMTPMAAEILTDNVTY